MSTSQFPKCLTANESNIPVPRKTQTEIKKSKRCAQLPELQKYIDTIIKASNECDSEDTSLSDRDKFPRERKFARYSVFKGLENKIKQDKIKNDLKLTRSKSNNKAKAPFSEAVSRDDKLPNNFVPEFEDPRNWKLNQTNYLGPNVEIEKFLKKFYPNPYHLETVTEFKDSKAEKDDLRDGTLPDVVISKTNIYTQGDIEKRDNDLVTADVQIKPFEMESKDTYLSSETSPNNPNGLSPRRKKSDDSTTTENLGTSSAPTLVKTPTDMNDSNSASSTTSQGSSIDTIKRVFRKESQMNFKKKKNLKCKTKFKPSKAEKHSDYDIGKLKLLNLSDSDEPTSEKKEIMKNNQTNESALIDEETSRTCAEIYKVTEFNDIKEIYDVMNKATESFLCISSRNQSRERSEESTEEQARGKTTEINSINPDDPGINSTETRSEEETNLVKNNLTYALLKGDNLNCTCNQKENTLEGIDDTEEKASSLSEQKGDVDDDDSHQKIDDVIDFMYDCLKKFNKKETQLQQEKNSRTEESTNIPKTTWKKMSEERPSTSQSSISTSQNESTESLLGKYFPEKRDAQCKYSAAVHEIRKKHFGRLRCKRKPDIFARNSFMFKQKIDEIPSESEMGRIVGLRQLEIQPVAYQRPVEVIEQNMSISTVVTVESQNELGGFTEDSRTLLEEETRHSKTFLPISAKLKKSRISTTRLKDVLEAEEKLMSKANPSENSQELGQVVAVNRPPSNALPSFGGFQQPSSNFVICVNSLPRDTVDFIKPTIPFPVSISLNDIKKSWDFKRLTIYPKFHSQKLPLPEDLRNGVMKRIYDLKKEMILTINKPVVAYAAMHVCMKAVTDHSRQTEEFSLKRSESLARILFKAIKQCIVSESFVARESVQMFILPSEKIRIEEKPVKALLKALEDAEEKVFLLEQSTESGENLSCRNSEMNGVSATETIRNEFSETENEKEGDKKKVHELLQRTYNLQQKLQKCLQKITTGNPTPLPNSDDRVLDVPVQNEIKTEFDIKPEHTLPLVHWHLKSSGVEDTKTESTKAESPTVDHSTTYDPPIDTTNEEEEKCEMSAVPEKLEEYDEDDDDDEDDRSSICSFKSSNDFSEGSECPKPPVSKRRFVKKIFNDFEPFRQSYESEKQQNDESKTEPPTEKPDNRLTHYDPKSSPKVLKTVFKGKRSSTELTIGLKDVPITKVGNISVEKTKFSPNHTKISICISREHAGDSPNKFSSYIFDHIRPSLSTCLTDISQMKDEVSKSSQSMNQESDDEEDDFKSVASTLGNSDSEEEKSEPKLKETVQPTPPRNFTKHRFDFYRKMDLDSGLNKYKNPSLSHPVCRYKELEPLKQALTEMQIRMRSIKRDAMMNSNDYYERALKLAKMSAGFCQNCGNRAVIPNDTFGYYSTLLSRKSTNTRRSRHYTTTMTRSPSYYSFRSSNAELNNPFYDLGIKHSSYSLHPAIHSNRTIVRSSLHDMPVLFEGI